MQFICPQCGGKHFGTSIDTGEDEFGTVTDVTITEHQCHDQFKVWRPVKIWKIGSKTFNQLGQTWLENNEFRIP